MCGRSSPVNGPCTHSGIQVGGTFALFRMNCSDGNVLVGLVVGG